MDSMEFNEQPLTYAEAVEHVSKFERLYKTGSEEFFAAVDKGTSAVDVHPDDLYEWRSYFAFKSDLDARLANALREESGEPLQEVVYSQNAGIHARPKTQAVASANNNLALAA